jgi:5-formyltetrahydrofolate cyclo-ligase
LKVAKKLPHGSYVAVYASRPKEANLSALFSLPLRFCFPRVLSDDGQMEFRWVKAAGKKGELILGPYNIFEPNAKHPLVQRNEIKACFAPLLAFDEKGRRLGNGKGFYDRFLDGFKGLKVGVGFEWQYSVTPLPDEAHDQPLDLVVTEHGIRDFRK